MELKQYIEAKKINKTELCDILGITRSSLYVWLDEKKPENIQKIKEAIHLLANNYVNGLDSFVNLNAQSIVGEMKGNARNEIIHNYGNQNEVDILKQENDFLKKKLELAEKEIELLKKEMELFKK